ncbi:LCP family protein [Halobacillus salinarum]|uniref:Regulatory protein MsrR n=1 Tax=Halobacillus salinarum TaxID=2932257 RepID=A0ABY4EH31_9BACI|nr:LCP family protein [Halobacillus salinarum]UOQ43441.1 LCP family protein [Halobacillus salinarum]
MANSRKMRKSRKKKRKRKIILAFISLLFLLVIGYTGYQYIAGKNEANSKVSGETQGGQGGLQETTSKYKDEFNGVKSNDGKTNVLLLGVDQRKNEIPRSDTIIIAQYDPKNNTAKMASIMRDTYVNIPGHGYNKINAAFAFGGPELLRKTISENFGVDLEYYSIVDFNGFVQIANTLAPDGLTVNVEEDMKYKDGSGTIDLDLEEGTQKLNGEDLLGYARFRHDSKGDFGRVERQQKVIKLLKDKLVSVNGILKAPRLIGNIQPYVDTNMGTGKIVSLAKDFLLNPVDDIKTTSIPEKDNLWNERKPYPIGLVLAHNEDQTREDIHQFLNGNSNTDEEQ